MCVEGSFSFSVGAREEAVLVVVGVVATCLQRDEGDGRPSKPMVEVAV